MIVMGDEAEFVNTTAWFAVLPRSTLPKFADGGTTSAPSEPDKAIAELYPLLASVSSREPLTVPLAVAVKVTEYVQYWPGLSCPPHELVELKGPEIEAANEIGPGELLRTRKVCGGLTAPMPVVSKASDEADVLKMSAGGNVVCQMLRPWVPARSVRV